MNEWINGLNGWIKWLLLNFQLNLVQSNKQLNKESKLELDMKIIWLVQFIKKKPPPPPLQHNEEQLF